MKPCEILFSVTLLVIALPVVPAVSAGTCKLPEGLYSRRESLERQYATDVGNDYLAHQQVADRILARERALDRNYYHPLFSRLCQAASAGKLDVVTECCATASDDPAGRLMCNLEYYIGDGRRDPARFLQGFPETRSDIGTLWNLDSMMVSSTPQREITPECGPSGPVDSYLNELFSLIARGNIQALNRFVHLSHYADGEYAEYLADQMKNLLIQEPDFVLAQWPTIRQFRDIEEIGSEFSDSERSESEQKYRDRCATESRACKEVQQAIASR